MRIEISGGIASGKTTLAKLLAARGFNCVFENFKANPFWDVYFSDPKSYYFETELTFCLQHYHDIKVLKDQNILCDYAICQDKAYAKIGIEENANRLKIFNLIHEELIADIGIPDIIIYLKCSVDTLLKRISKRGRKEEQGIDVIFLEKLNRNIFMEISALSPITKIITIDSEQKNFAHNTDDQNEIINLILDSI